MLLITNRRPVVHLPLAHEGRVEPREVADRFFVSEVPQALGERREARLAAHEDGRPDHLAQIKIGRLLGRQRPNLGEGHVVGGDGWACWKTYLGRPEGDELRLNAMTLLGNGLTNAKHYEEALSVYEAELATQRRLGSHPERILVTRTNIALTYQQLRRPEEALQMHEAILAGRRKLNGQEDSRTLVAAQSYAMSLMNLRRLEAARSVSTKFVPVARRVLGEGHELTLKMRMLYAGTFYYDANAALDDLREAVKTIEDVERTARRVLGNSHPLTGTLGSVLRDSRARLAARETLSAGSA